jgi:hypothetical protein
MPANSDRSGGILGVVLAIAWLAFVVAYPLTWRPRVEPFAVAAGHQALSLKLPDNGPLRLMIKENSQLRLAMVPASAAKADNWLGVADATLPLPSQPTFVDATVLAKTCFSADKQSDCWAVLSVAENDAPSVLRAGHVWVLVTRP